VLSVHYVFCTNGPLAIQDSESHNLVPNNEALSIIPLMMILARDHHYHTADIWLVFWGSADPGSPCPHNGGKHGEGRGWVLFRAQCMSGWVARYARQRRLQGKILHRSVNPLTPTVALWVQL